MVVYAAFRRFLLNIYETMGFKFGHKEYLERYYIGHYNPRGNVFCASAIRQKLVEMLEPKPLPYGNKSGVHRKIKRNSN